MLWLRPHQVSFVLDRHRHLHEALLLRKGRMYVTAKIMHLKLRLFFDPQSMLAPLVESLHSKFQQQIITHLEDLVRPLRYEI
jgi:hypothetical protein